MTVQMMRVFEADVGPKITPPGVRIGDTQSMQVGRRTLGHAKHDNAVNCV